MAECLSSVWIRDGIVRVRWGMGSWGCGSLQLITMSLPDHVVTGTRWSENGVIGLSPVGFAG